MTTAPTIESISVLTFGANNILFVGDSYSGKVFAFELEDEKPASESLTYNIYGLDQRIASFLGVSVDLVTVNDLAVHPLTHEAYIGVTRGHGKQAIPIILVVNQAGKIRNIEWDSLKYSHIALNHQPDRITFWHKVPAQSLTITDIEYADGEIYVAGLSNGNFASTLYRIPYPFKDDIKASSVEIYHAVHNQNETRAPIRTLSVVDLNGKLHVLAAYTCTPLVTIPVDQLLDGAHVKGKTIGELGYGNTPIDMVRFSAPGSDGVEDYVLISNKARSGMMLKLKDIMESNAGVGLSTPVQLPHQVTAGVAVSSVPLAGVMHIDNQDEQFFLTIRRDLDMGRLDLLSLRKGFYFRLSDFINEYDFPDYAYPDNAFQQNYVRNAHQILKTDEGYQDLIK
ncbi:hypothetical protein [Iningainema tapete]|uniref:Uncharacterized protein n=1 Tax=Iningainema tapete BLCC-T55 TaxID=2748662 RepID=A0A8J6XUD8_9CYAN|nr:hypothetical protein [Iningainema tapete]MBD2777786.1 hypothetical protein [Iningainema tapete BLCC-T55]